MPTYANTAFIQLLSLSYMPFSFIMTSYFSLPFVHHFLVLSYFLGRDIPFSFFFHNKLHLPPVPNSWSLTPHPLTHPHVSEIMSMHVDHSPPILPSHRTTHKFFRN